MCIVVSAWRTVLKWPCVELILHPKVSCASADGKSVLAVSVPVKQLLPVFLHEAYPAFPLKSLCAAAATCQPCLQKLAFLHLASKSVSDHCPTVPKPHAQTASQLLDARPAKQAEPMVAPAALWCAEHDISSTYPNVGL